MSSAGAIPASVPLGTRASGDSFLAEEGTPASRPLADAVRAVQLTLGPKAAEQLAGITGQDAKTAQRQMAKGRPPSGPAVFLMATDPEIGPAFLDQGSRRLARDDYLKFWRGVGLRALKALATPPHL